ncbi:MAG TPA: EAL domain-containing protein [Gammaproteobacteria bacterium]|nr:EAL domain-containing protein [Gammaproteobacteria bacterium]
MRPSEADFRRLFEHSPDGIVLLGVQDGVIDANPAFQAMFGYTLEEMRGRSIRELIVPPERTAEFERLFARVLAGQMVRVMTVRRRKDGTPIAISLLAYPVTLSGGRRGICGVFQDLTEQRGMVYRMTHDALTGLLDRHEFERRVSAFLAANPATAAALLYLDVDQFKVINDACGHMAGDRLLVELTGIIRSTVRAEDAIARLGGDEFGIFLSGCSEVNALQVAGKIANAIDAHHFQWQGKSFKVTASIGIAPVMAGPQGFAELLAAADIACDVAKENGRNRVHVCRTDDIELRRRRDEMFWVSRIREALEQDRFVLYRQAIRRLDEAATERERYELLVRMLDENGKLIPPAEFIPAAERYNLMPAIDRWVIRHACQRLHELAAARTPFRGVIAINVSGTTLSDEAIVDFIRACFDEYGIEPASVCFEITETAAITNLSHAIRFINDMHGLGCSIALDDFGSGMSSFHYLKSLRADYLKIDGVFIKGIVSSPTDSAMTEAINRLGHVLGLKTVAEFVENTTILEHLRKLGVDYGQGYGIHKPEPW